REDLGPAAHAGRRGERSGIHLRRPLSHAPRRGAPIVLIAGTHVGCFELVGTEQVRTIRDLQGKTVAISDVGNTDHAFLASILVYIGLDPRLDVHWVTHPAAEAMQLLSEGKIDAFIGFPPRTQELRARQIGHVLLNSSVDRPWSQY